MINLMAFSTT